MRGSFPAMPSPRLSPTGSLRQWQADPGGAHHLRGCSAREPSTGWDSWGKSEAQRWSHGGVVRKPHPCRGARADRKGRKLACPPGELTPQRSPGVPRKQRRYAPPPPQGPKDRAGEGRQLRVRTGRQCLRAASPPRSYSAAPPRKSGVFRAALCRGGGEAEERRLRAPLELRFPVEGWRGWFVEAALTATAAAAASAAAAAAWRRPIHPPAAGRLTAWEGPRAWAARLLRVVARASSSSTNPLPSPPPPPSSSSSSSQPTARPLLKPGSSVAMTPGKHSQAADAGGWGPGTAEPLGKGRRALVCGSPPCSALRRPPASRPALPRKFRTRSVVHSSRSRRQPLGLERVSQRIRSRGAPRRLRLLWPRSVFIDAPLRCSAPASYASKCFCL